jgi:threonylcarbamoyladenosine tRNA methylthiotransferase MtaB
MRVAVLTFGCRVNQAESLAIERELYENGATIVDSGAAELVVVNSCSVTATADQGTRQSIRRVARENPAARIVVTGCYATRAPGEVASLPGVVHIVANARKEDVVKEALAAVRAASPKYVGQGFSPASGLGSTQTCSAGIECPGDGASGRTEALPHLPLFLGNRTAFTLRVQTGCEEGCSYCVIPFTRGPERSRPPEALADEVRRLESAGYLDVTLTGVHLGSYGRDLEPSTTLPALVDRLLEATAALRLRLGSLEPLDCSPTLVDRAAAGGRLAPAFHLPLQHASDRVLRAMRRPYGLDEYDQVVRYVRERVRHASITADVIVGFPGETDDDFDVLARYLAASPLTQLHVFPYSDRPGTEASAMAGKLHGTVVRERARVIREIGAQLAERFRREQAGTVRPALAIDDGMAAVTDNGLRVRLDRAHPRNSRIGVLLGPEAATGCVVESGWRLPPGLSSGP